MEEWESCATLWNGSGIGFAKKCHYPYNSDVEIEPNNQIDKRSKIHKHKRSEKAKKERIEKRKINRRQNRQNYREMTQCPNLLATDRCTHPKAQEVSSQLAQHHSTTEDLEFKTSPFTPDLGGGIEKFLYSEEIQKIKEHYHKRKKNKPITTTHTTHTPPPPSPHTPPPTH